MLHLFNALHTIFVKFIVLWAVCASSFVNHIYRFHKNKILEMSFSVEHLIINYRWLLVCFFLLPASLLYNIWNYIRNFIVFNLSSAPGQHVKKVKEVQHQVKSWIASGMNVPMCTARPGWQTMSFRQGIYKKSMYNININLVDVLEIDSKKKTVRVEPLVTMGQLTATLAPLGWTIPILPEIDDLTIGGLIMGTGIESSSHKFGLFQHICVSYELVLADGSIVTCSKESDPDLFYSVPWSYGTLGFLTAAEIKIVPCTNFIKLKYKPVYSLEEAVKVFTEESVKQEGNEFVEGLMFELNKGVIMTGNMVKNLKAGDKLNEIGRWYKPWFFKHVEGFLRTKKQGEEVIPLRDYYHRHTRSLFWELQDIVPFGNNPLFRLLVGWMMPPKVSFLKLTQSESIKKLYEQNHIIQDMLIPIKHMKCAIEMFHQEISVYPMWLCPFKLSNDPGMLNSKSKNDEMYVDIGVYGVPKVKNFQAKETTRRIEKFVQNVNGFQMLYADTYTTREEFYQMFDHTLYNKMRNRLNIKNAFPEVYDKVNKNARS